MTSTSNDTVVQLFPPGYRIYLDIEFHHENGDIEDVTMELTDFGASATGLTRRQATELAAKMHEFAQVWGLYQENAPR